MCRDKDKATLFRGWSRLCLHAASLSAAEGASAAATAAARATRAEAMQLEAVAAAEKVKALEAAARTSADGAAGTGERAQREASGETLTAMTHRMGALEQALTTERWRRAGMLVSEPNRCGTRVIAPYMLEKTRRTGDLSFSSEPSSHPQYPVVSYPLPLSPRA